MNMPCDIPESIGGAERNLYRNASASPMIMRVSPFGGWDQLRKTYRGEGFTGNRATEHGHKYEAIAREAAAKKLNLDLAGPTRLILGDYAASLDDITKDGKVILEIKCPFQGKDSKIWKSVRDYGEPSYDFWQMQHQLFCAPDAEIVVLFLYDSATGDSIYTEVDRDPNSIARLKAEWDKFWTWKDTEEPDNQDGWMHRDDYTWHQVAERYLEAKKAFDGAKDDLDVIKQELIDLSEADKVQGSGISLIKTSRIGSVDYKKVPQLAGVDLDQYRGEPTDVWTVTTKKGGK